MRREATVYLALLILTLATYWPVTGYDFINYDDPLYVYKNVHVQSGLTVESVHWAFTSIEISIWHPLTWFSHMLDWQIFGSNPHACHAVSLAFHAANALLLLLVLQRLTGALWQSAFVAALFALHPLHVESVAWVSERKDVLSSFFGLVTILAYIGYARKRTVLKYLLVLVSFALALMSKPMLVTLPVLLLLLDFWPLKRFAFQTQGKETPASGSVLSAWSLMAEKVPLLVLALADSIVTLFAQERGATIETLEHMTIGARLANAAFGYALYLGKMIWPTHLAVFYPRQAVPVIEALVAGALIVSITWLALIKARVFPFFLVGWFWFLIMLMPVSGLVQAGAQALADRYSYLPLVGLFVIVIWGSVEMANRFKWPQPMMAAGGVALILACALTTHHQVGYWENSTTLFRHAIQVTSRNYLAENNLGVALMDTGKPDEADAHFETAIALRPSYAQAHYNSGASLLLQKKPDEAEAQFRMAIQEFPSYVSPHKALALLLYSKGKYDEAESHLRTVLDSNPDDREVREMLGNTLALEKKNNDAQVEFEELLKKAPTDPMLHRNLGNVYVAEGNSDAAHSEYSKALELCPTNDLIRETMATFLLQNEKTEEATDILRKGLQIAPTTRLYGALATLELKIGNPSEAVRVYREALQFKPNAPGILNNLAWILATNPDDKIRNGTEAVELAEEACRLSQNKQPVYIGTLAAAYAEAGRFPEAVATGQKACDAASAGGMTEMLKKNQELLEKYRGGRAYREPGA